MKTVTITTGLAALAAAALAVAGCSTTSIQKAGSAPTSPSAARATTSAAPTPPANTGRVGTTYKVSSTDDSGNSMSYNVTLVHVSQHAAPDNSFDAASTGHHLASAEFRITGVSGSAQDDADSDAGVNGTNQQVYDPSFDGLSAGTNFSGGDFSVSAGQTQVGYVAFELPDSTRVASVTWQPDISGSDAPATWTIGS